MLMDKFEKNLKENLSLFCSPFPPFSVPLVRLSISGFFMGKVCTGFDLFFKKKWIELLKVLEEKK